MKLLTIIFILVLLVFSVNAQYLGLKDFTFTHDSIDVRTGAKSVTFTVTATETDSVSILFRPIGFSWIGVLPLEAVGIGVFQNTMTYPVYTPSRTEEIYEIRLVDDNAHIGEFYSTKDIAALGFKTNFQIIGNNVINPPKSRKRISIF